jgi:hypothetical protein
MIEDQNTDPLAAARTLGAQILRGVLEFEGGVAPESLAIQLLDTNEEELRGLRERGLIIGIPTLTFRKIGIEFPGDYVYPNWQFDSENSRLIPGLSEVLASLEPGMSPISRLGFILSDSNINPGKSVLDLIREGKSMSLLREARSYGIHGAR